MLGLNNDFTPDELTVKVSELLVATADAADKDVDEAVPEVLKLLRDRMHMDVVFVSEFVDGKRVFRHVAAAPSETGIVPGASDPLEESWCQQVVDGRIPQFVKNAATDPATRDLNPGIPIGTHISTPIVLKDGQVYGTLCTFSHGVNESATERDLKNLQYTAQLTARKIEKQQEFERQHKKPPESVPDWSIAESSTPKYRK